MPMTGGAKGCAAYWKDLYATDFESASVAHLLLQLLLSSLEVLDEQVLPRQLVVVREMVDALPVRQVQLIQLVVDPSAAQLKFDAFFCM